MLIVHIGWGKRAVFAFNAQYVAGEGGTLFSRVAASRMAVYWQPSIPITGNSGAQAQILSTMKNGYVVTLISMSLRQSQDEQALLSIISRL